MAKPLEELRKIRLEKLKKIKKRGINPYPARSQRKQIIAQALKMMGKKVAVAGRIMAIREHGGIQFFDLRDESGRIQLVFKKERLSPNHLSLIPLLDIGDFIDTQGKIFKTKAGEISVLVEDFHLLTKSLRPLPSKWYGLKDVEERYRKRYLDLIMSPQSKKIFEIRSGIIQAMREFLLKKGYIEVETPVLQSLYGGGLARPFKTYHNVLGIPLYMRISTELYLKRLTVGGFEKVFEIAKVFRNEGIDKNHNPEFTILETMEAYIDYKENMKLVEEMTEYAVKKTLGTTEVVYEGKKVDFKTPWKRITMNEAVKKTTGIDFSKIKNLKEAIQKAKELDLELEEYQQRAVGLILATAFEEKVEKTLIQPTFIYDFPVETSPLAKKCEDDPRFVERFEHFAAGMELSNNYSELNDPLELAVRFRKERKKEKLGDEEAHQTDEDFIEAMEYGMPPTSGIGPGIDRLVLIICNHLGAQNLRDVILFPTLRPKKKRGKVIRRKEALKFLNEKIGNKNIIKHMLATEALMGEVYEALRARGEANLGGTKEEWMMAGLLHDGDYCEEVLPEKQGVQVTEWLRERGYEISDNVAQAMAAHNAETGVTPKTLMDWAIFCGDSLTGLIVATTLVHPKKKLASITVESVMKKFKDKAFARGTRREDIAKCEEKLGIPLPEFIGIALRGMQNISDDLGL